MAGAAAGVASATNTPIGGLLFALDDLSSFWTKTSTFQTFYCCVFAAITSSLFSVAFSGYEYRYQFGALRFSVRFICVLIIETLNKKIENFLADLFFDLSNAFINSKTRTYDLFRY